MSKKILYGKHAQQSLAQGVNIVASAVKGTIGPRGSNVAYDRGYGAPIITNDGVSIAKEITLADKFENMGAEIVKEVAMKTNEKAGDGTTTSIILADAIVQAGIKALMKGSNGLQLRHGIEAATIDAISKLSSMSRSV
ncbi:chaperonin GroEL, partial [Patescibacteria group bacterium]|nr:chaperonin GroEL [Patescibacteria group bacterium]